MNLTIVINRTEIEYLLKYSFIQLKKVWFAKEQELNKKIIKYEQENKKINY